MNNATQYIKQAIEKTGKELGLKNPHQFPRIEKVVVHVGIGKDKDNKTLIAALEKDLAKITGQKPSFTKAKKSLATFKLRAGEPIGIIITLRGKKMADFLSKTINISLPAIRDFRGIKSSAFDEQGNYSFGVKEHTVFPEISFGSENIAHGVQITVTTTTKNKSHAYSLLKQLGFPFDSQPEFANTNEPKSAKTKENNA